MRSLMFLLVLALTVTAAATAEPSRTVVVWISLDGMRGDFVDRYPLRTLREMMSQGCSSRHMRGTFPTLTFASHTSLATGVPAGTHGIVGNSFYDRQTGRLHQMPTQSKLLQAEPIWVTAARQGVRSIVLDWPLSYDQQGPNRAAVFSPTGYARGLTDRQRFDKLIQAWQAEQGPVGLLMGYCPSVDASAHHDGPDSSRLGKTLLAVDAELARLRDRAVALYLRRSGPQDRLFFVVTADHGMSATHTVVNPQILLGALPPQVNVAENSTSLLLYCGTGPRRNLVRKLSERLKNKPGVRLLTARQIPARWRYANRARTPDLLVLARPGWSFSPRASRMYQPSGPLGQRGNHGYPAEECPQMDALLVIWQYGHSLGGRDLGPVSQLRVNPTVCRLLGIQPAPGATAAAITPGSFTSVQHPRSKRANSRV